MPVTGSLTFTVTSGNSPGSTLQALVDAAQAVAPGEPSSLMASTLTTSNRKRFAASFSGIRCAYPARSSPFCTSEVGPWQALQLSAVAATPP